MKEKFREINLYRTNLILPGEEGEEMLISKVTMDADGNETERLTIHGDDEPEERILTKYENGKPVEEILEIGGEVAERTTREFNGEGVIIREWRHYLEGDPDEIKYTYEAGRLISKISYDSDGDEMEKHLLFYESGRLVREEEYDSFGNKELERTFTYGEAEHPESSVEIRNSGDERTRIVTEFDEAGNVTLEKRYDHRGNLIARSITTTGEGGRPAKIEEETVRGKTIATLEYDEKGNNTRYKEEDEAGNELTEITRTFDADGRNRISEVKSEPMQFAPGQHYRLRYEYLPFSE